jgi:hypothetical protein
MLGLEREQRCLWDEPLRLEASRSRNTTTCSFFFPGRFADGERRFANGHLRITDAKSGSVNAETCFVRLKGCFARWRTGFVCERRRSPS